MRAMSGTEQATYEDLRPLVFSIAYRMTGSVTEAEDIVQEAFLRFHRATVAGARVESPKAYLAATATRLAIDHLRSARARRETYVGPWLPEPLVTEEVDVEAHAEMADSLSMAFLVLLETLSPVERAVFLLREAFDYGYGEIAEVVGKSEENCRQIASRARRQLQARKPRFEADRRRRDELAARFFAACDGHDIEGLVRLLADDVVMQGDGGGVAPAVGKPVHGGERVARFLLGLIRQAERQGQRYRRVTVNGQPGALVVDADGRPVSVLSLDIADGVVQAVRAVVNPEKLRHLGS